MPRVGSRAGLEGGVGRRGVGGSGFLRGVGGSLLLKVFCGPNNGAYCLLESGRSSLLLWWAFSSVSSCAVATDRLLFCFRGDTAASS